MTDREYKENLLEDLRDWKNDETFRALTMAAYILEMEESEQQNYVNIIKENEFDLFFENLIKKKTQLKQGIQPK